MKIAVFWPTFGPYHIARLEFAHSNLSTKGIEILGIEIAENEAQYTWEANLEGTGFRRFTLFPKQSYEKISTARVQRAVFAVLNKLTPDTVAVCGYANVESRAGIDWCRQWKRGVVLISDSNSFDSKRSWLKELAKGFLVRRCDSAFVAGTSSAEYMNQLGMNMARIHQGCDVVDNAFFCRNADNEREQKRKNGDPNRYFISVCRFLEKKNLLELLSAFKHFKQTTGDRFWKLLLVGDGPLRPKIETRVRQLDLEGSVELKGFKQYHELPAMYALGSVFILVSRFEQWGLVVNEAMASGLPVLLSTTAGSYKDLLVEGKNGYGVNPYDESDIAVKLCELSKKSPKQLSIMGKESTKIIANWDLRRFAEGIEAAAKTAVAHAKLRKH